MFTILLIVHGVLSLGLVGLVLLQQGKGADMGATIGGGGSSSVFGGAGAVDFISKLTTGLAIAFMCTSILLARSYVYRASSALGTKSQDFLKGSLFDESDAVDNTTVTEAVKVEDGSVQRQAGEGESQNKIPAGASSEASADASSSAASSNESTLVVKPDADTGDKVAAVQNTGSEKNGMVSALEPEVKPEAVEKSIAVSEDVAAAGVTVVKPGVKQGVEVSQPGTEAVKVEEHRAGEGATESGEKQINKEQ